MKLDLELQTDSSLYPPLFLMLSLSPCSSLPPPPPLSFSFPSIQQAATYPPPPASWAKKSAIGNAVDSTLPALKDCERRTASKEKENPWLRIHFQKPAPTNSFHGRWAVNLEAAILHGLPGIDYKQTCFCSFFSYMPNSPSRAGGALCLLRLRESGLG